MKPVYSSGYEPDPQSARDVLAFVLCPMSVFAPGGDADEIEAVAEMLLPAKEQAIQRWQDAHDLSLRC